MNKDLDPCGRRDSVVAIDGLFQVEAAVIDGEAFALDQADIRNLQIKETPRIIVLVNADSRRPKRDRILRERWHATVAPPYNPGRFSRTDRGSAKTQ